MGIYTAKINGRVIRRDVPKNRYSPAYGVAAGDVPATVAAVCSFG